MIYLTFYNNELTLDDISYQIESMEKYDDSGVNLHITNSMYNAIYTVQANITTINDVLQTSADMIIETLSNG